MPVWACLKSGVTTVRGRSSTGWLKKDLWLFRQVTFSLFFRGLLPRIPMHLKKLKWPEVQALDFDRRIALVPLGSIEQHSLHLPLSVDTDIVTELAERVEGARPERIVLLPTLSLGHSP